MFPLRDDNPAKTIPVVTWTLIALNVVVFFYQVSLGPSAEQLLVYQYGAIPAVVTGGGALSERVAVIPPYLSLLTNIFLHGGWMHLRGNMWFLWIFGDNVEEAMGRLRYLLFYLLAGLLASISHVFSDAGSTVPCIGASGAISGVLGAYLLLYPRARVLTLIFLGFFSRLIYIPAGFVLGFWFLLQLLSGGAAGAGNAGGVAFWAHIGGFLAGMLLVGLFKKREIRFLNPPHYQARYSDNW
jgi:membrane associated rhomboid family serine protease